MKARGTAVPVPRRNGATEQADEPERFVDGRGHHVTVILTAIAIGLTLGAITGSLYLAAGFGIGFGLISGLVCETESRRGLSQAAGTRDT